MSSDSQSIPNPAYMSNPFHEHIRVSNRTGMPIKCRSYLNISLTNIPKSTDVRERSIYLCFCVASHICGLEDICDNNHWKIVTDMLKYVQFEGFQRPLLHFWGKKCHSEMLYFRKPLPTHLKLFQRRTKMKPRIFSSRANTSHIAIRPQPNVIPRI